MHLHHTQLADGAAVRSAFDGTLVNTHAGNMASWNTWGTSNAEKLTSYNCPQESFTSFTQSGNPSFLNYNPGRGGMGINRFNANGQGVTTTGSEAWIERMDADGAGSFTLWGSTWSRRWT